MTGCFWHSPRAASALASARGTGRDAALTVEKNGAGDSASPAPFTALAAYSAGHGALTDQHPVKHAPFLCKPSRWPARLAGDTMAA
jgi:hypothetical protein